MTQMSEKQQKAEEIAAKIWKLSRDKLLVNLRFLDVALAGIAVQPRFGIGGVCFESAGQQGIVIYYEPAYVLHQYQMNPNNIMRLHLHILFHCIFNHTYRYQRVEQDLWNVAADIAVENAILGLGISGFETIGDDERRRQIAIWEKKIRMPIRNEAGNFNQFSQEMMTDGQKGDTESGASVNKSSGVLTAERIYKRMKENYPEPDELLELGNLFRRDNHESWLRAEPETLELTQAQFKKISERIKAELKAFSQDKSDDRSILQNLEEATKEEYNYDDFLRRFSVSGEDMQINDDEFDYVYYTYGLNLYGNLPLVEPLEYKDVNKIKEFVVVLDTSASCRGKVVQAFLNKTYNILKSSENFFRKVNIHIIQCDSQVRGDTKITNDEEFEAFMKEGQLEGFGSTDFRPAFAYVNNAIENGVFENLKGLIYFTDGYGVFPEKKPPYNYDTAFVFLEDDYDKPQIPPWAMKLVLPAEDKEDVVS